VIKKRTGYHEDTIREFWIRNGLQLGEPLTNFQGVLRGVPWLTPEMPSGPPDRA
jgi:circadian clock protein KaiC